MTSHHFFANQFPYAHSCFGRLPIQSYQNLCHEFAALGRDATFGAKVGDRLYLSFDDSTKGETIKVFCSNSGQCLMKNQVDRKGAIKCLQDIQACERGLQDEITSVSFFNQTNFFFTGSEKGFVKVWMVEENYFESNFSLLDEEEYSPIKSDTPKSYNDIKAHDKAITFLHFYPNLKLVTSSADNTVKIWTDAMIDNQSSIKLAQEGPFESSVQDKIFTSFHKALTYNRLAS